MDLNVKKIIDLLEIPVVGRIIVSDYSSRVVNLLFALSSAHFSTFTLYSKKNNFILRITKVLKLDRYWLD